MDQNRNKKLEKIKWIKHEFCKALTELSIECCVISDTEKITKYIKGMTESFLTYFKNMFEEPNPIVGKLIEAMARWSEELFVSLFFSISEAVIKAAENEEDDTIINQWLRGYILFFAGTTNNLLLDKLALDNSEKTKCITNAIETCNSTILKTSKPEHESNIKKILN